MEENPTTELGFYNEATAPGAEMHSYSTRRTSEDGKHVVIVEHTERMELVKQPPTPEEIAFKRKQEKIASWLAGGFVLLGITVVVYAILKDEKEYQMQQRRLREREGELDSSERG